MAIAIIVTDRNVDPLKQQILANLQDQVPIYIYPHIPEPDQVEMAIVWKHPKGILSTFPNLQLVSSLGAGVEHITTDPDLPPNVCITRTVESTLVQSMRNYILMSVFNIQRRFLFYQANQRQSRWEKARVAERNLKVGILGLGVLGSAVAQILSQLQLEVFGYSRSSKSIEGVQCFNSQNCSLQEFASRINLLICLLPATPATKDTLNIDLFRSLPKGSFLINAARGIHLVEADLIQALDEGHIEEAYLDVFREEPLPKDHPFWQRPNIVITPHIASLTNLEEGAKVLAENYRSMKDRQAFLYEVDRNRGY